MKNKDIQILKLSKKELRGYLILGWIGVIFGVMRLCNNHRYFSLQSLFLVVFGLVLIINISFWPHSLYALLITPEGFIIKTLLSRKSFRWMDVRNFEIKSSLNGQALYFNFSDSYKEQNLCLAGFGKLTHSYGLKPEELADLLNRKRSEYLAQS